LGDVCRGCRQFAWAGAGMEHLASAVFSGQAALMGQAPNQRIFITATFLTVIKRHHLRNVYTEVTRYILHLLTASTEHDPSAHNACYMYRT
jgi:hypothetical protein